MLIEGLPAGGVTYRAVNGHGWTDTHYLLADVIDATNAAAHALVQQQAGKRLAKPRRYPRPGDTPGYERTGNRAGRDVGDVVAYLDSLKPKGA